VLGFDLMTSGGFGQALLGMGPGFSSLEVTRAAGLEAVWSVLLNYLYDTGAIGLIAVAWIAQHLLRTWKALRFDMVFISVLGVWLVGVTLTTSYEQLLPLWLALGWMTVWPAFTQPLVAPAQAALQERTAGRHGAGVGIARDQQSVAEHLKEGSRAWR
jgi:hypothetical protein